MKWLNRLYLVKWHYIEQQVIEFERINFLTGKNATGKSTIIDAIQLVMLGDTRGHYFNKAANEQSRRSLKGYLYGETGYNEAEGVVYLRKDEDFSTYVMAEFYHEAKQEYFTIGVVFDCGRDGRWDHKFFILEAPIPEHRFIFDAIPLGISELRKYMTKHYDRSRFQFFDSDKAYREGFKGVMGRIKGDYFDLFRKAVPFTPIMNIKQFITEFVCETQNKVDIEHMRENIRQYKLLEHQAETIKSRIQSLEAIEEAYQAYDELSHRWQLERYALLKAEADETDADRKHLMDELDRKEADLQAVQRRVHEIEGQLTEASAVLETLRKQYYSSKERGELEQLEVSVRQAKDALSQSEHAKTEVERRLLPLTTSWMKLVDEIENHEPEIVTQELRQLTESIQTQAGAFPFQFKRTDFSDWRLQTEETVGRIRQALEGIRVEMNRLQKEQQACRSRWTKLREGHKEYPNRELGPLRDTIIRELSARSGKPVSVDVLCELLEVRDPQWRQAVEGYLNNQRFYLIVPPEHYTEAVQIYDRIKFERKFYDIGLVDVGKIMERKPSVQAGSLAEEVTTDNPYARAYIDYILGRVIKCQRVEELRRHSTAITPSCMLYSGFVSRQIHPRVYETPYLGRKALDFQAKQLEREIYQLQEQLEMEWQPKLELYHAWSKAPLLSEWELDQLLAPEGTAALANLQPVRYQAWTELRERMDQFDLSGMQRLEQQVKHAEAAERALLAENSGYIKRLGELETDIRSLKQYQLPDLEAELQQKESSIRDAFPEDWIREYGWPYYAQEHSGQPKLKALRDRLASLAVATEYEKGIHHRKLVELRFEYLKSHKATLDHLEEGNDSWFAELRRMRDTSLPDYEDQIVEARERASVQFQEDFVSKLKENIEAAYEHISDLNHAIASFHFGRKSYKFDIKPHATYRDFYRMITDDMLMEGRSIFSDVFMQKHGDAVEQLFHKIVYTGEDTGSPEQIRELEENLVKYTDYRTYLDFDLMEIDEKGAESSLSKVIATKSGGETQTPFYIAVLASFLQTYRVKHPSLNQTVRLIVFDEAFSKMDHQRIRECIKLVRNMGLQIIISAPTEKLADIAPLVDRNLCVTRIRNRTHVKAFDPRELLEEDAG
ncbi:SbcC/MukB-like Walker B domain-containing protein [Paenibacillus sp. GD4]|uniref:ATP-binding protein n=1 Tax=Paenibacillus sp. GD4 TaxID=3068890 RepID=UPI002796D422|nr:SbcC/MukB-like Walker B domain-containing protein [Paenibacillus sp. GD4]MDQ1913606.1 SbcC/MukB-like Walker B domain-containing protein [Paenibacillus sp. GD4]